MKVRGSPAGEREEEYNSLHSQGVNRKELHSIWRLLIIDRESFERPQVE